VEGRSGQLAPDLVGRVRAGVCAALSRNRFVDLLEADGVPRERLTWLAGEQFRIVGSDQRSFALLAARFPDPPAGEMFLSLAQGERNALGLLADFAAALGWQERDLRAYEPRPLAQAYPAMELNGWASPQMLRRYGVSARSARARRTYDRIVTPVSRPTQSF
jgi:hypothetical protein